MIKFVVADMDGTLLNSKKEGSCDFSNWVVPTYIKEGLLWLRKD